MGAGVPVVHGGAGRSHGASAGDDGPARVRQILAGLDPVQRACVVDPNRLVVIEAGAGSGKTRVLTSRIAYRVATGTADAEHTAVFTFTRKAAAELGHRLAALGVQGAWCGTVHGAARQLLDRYWSDLGRRPLVIRTDTERLVAEALGPDDGALAGVVHRELAWAGPRAIAAADYPAAARAAGRGRGLAVEDVARAMARYETYKRRRGVMDLDDLLRLAASAMEDRRFRDAVHWRFRHLAIDEAQDLNRAQWQFLRQLLGDPADCCLVGDADQTVYEWNGADARFLTGFHRLFPGASRHQLATNFRSAPPIVALGDRILGRTDATPAASERAGTITVLAAADEEDEAAQVAWRVRQLRGSGAGWSQIAVLARTRALLEPTERRLRAAGIPVRTGRGLLEEPVVAAVLAELARLPADRPARTVAVDVAEVADDVVERRRSQGAGDEREQARCAQLVELVQEWASNDPMATAGQLGNWLASVVRPVGGEPGDPAIGVELATFHRAKGLQFPHVLLVGLEDGVVPLAHSAQPAEERRLLYVAVTRAEQSLTCSWAARRRVGGIERDRAPSPWLATVEEVGGRWEVSAAGSPASAREQVAALRCRLEGVRRSA